MPYQVVKPRRRGFICVTAHPKGCARNVEDQIEYVRTHPWFDPLARIRNVLVIGASTGYGLSTRIAAGWGMECNTLGVFLERPPKGKRTATAGYYNSVALHRAAKRDGLWARSINGDAFSDHIKDDVADAIAESMGKVDLVVYSLASPKRKHPETGKTHSSTLKTIGHPFTEKTIDLAKAFVKKTTVGPATDKEIDDTVAVMGGDDWTRWIERLLARGVLADGAQTVAYSYYGPRLTWPIYREGTIGIAKADLRETADRLNDRLFYELGGGAWISVNKAVVTQASAAIPVVPLYISLLYRVMKKKGIHEGCIEQMVRLLNAHLSSPVGPGFDDDRMVRLDDREMRREVQDEVSRLWPQVDSYSLHDLTDFEGFMREFYKLFGFGVEGVDYAEPVETEVFLETHRGRVLQRDDLW